MPRKVSGARGILPRRADMSLDDGCSKLVAVCGKEVNYSARGTEQRNMSNSHPDIDSDLRAQNRCFMAPFPMTRSNFHAGASSLESLQSDRALNFPILVPIAFV